MPKLSSEAAKKVDEAEDSFEALPENVYEAVLTEVEAKDGKNGRYWKWSFKITTPEYEGRQQWTNTSLSEKAHWKLKEVFQAFNASTDTDTDTLIGQKVQLMVVQKIINDGPRMGQTGNDIRQVLALQPAEGGISGGKSKSKSNTSRADDIAPLY
jgi:hypothetical protein